MLLDAVISEVGALLGVRDISDRGKGMHGYTDSLDADGYAIIAHGGEQQRGTVFVSINGGGCMRIARFRSVRDWAEPLGARITRLDIAADDYDSSSFDIARGLEAYKEKAFNSGGRRPKARLIDDLGSGNGKSFYVGTRQGGKMMRLYEKGKQLGDSSSAWTRAEVEFHAKDRVIPWDAVTEPCRYLAGAYPFFSELSMVAEKMRTIKHGAAISLAAAERWVRHAAGPTVDVLLQQYGGDIGAVIQSIRRSGVPKRLRIWLEAQARLGGEQG